MTRAGSSAPASDDSSHSPTGTGIGQPHWTDPPSSTSSPSTSSDRGDNVVLVGAHGLGKTMLAKNIAHQAVLAGTLRTLHHRRRPAPRPQRTGDRTRPSNAGCATTHARRSWSATRWATSATDARAADLIFQLVSRRYEHRSLLDHHQPALQTLGHRLPQRLVRRRTDRPLDPPCRNPSPRRRQLSQARGPNSVNRSETASARADATQPSGPRLPQRQRDRSISVQKPSLLEERQQHPAGVRLPGGRAGRRRRPHRLLGFELLRHPRHLGRRERAADRVRGQPGGCLKD